MEFKSWLNEIVEPQKPGKVTKSTVIKNKGTNTARPIMQFYWKTALGNKVKLQLDKKDENEYDVVFYVNDTHYDDATASDGRIRDPEVLNSVIYVLKNKTNDLNINKFHFKAQDSPKDYRLIHNLPSEPLKSNLINNLSSLIKHLETRTPVMLPPSQERIDLAKKFNRPIPQAKEDFRKENIEELKNTLIKIQNNQLVDYDQFIDLKDFANINYNPQSLIEMMKEFNQIITSQTGGWNRYKNRRAEVYDKLMKKYFPDWIIERSRNNFTLTRV